VRIGRDGGGTGWWSLGHVLALRFEALVNRTPLLNRQPLLFVQRHPYAYDHHNTHNISPGAPNENGHARLRPGSALNMIDFSRSGDVKTIFDSRMGLSAIPACI